MSNFQSRIWAQGRRIWACPPEIFRTNVTTGIELEKTIVGEKFLFRSDFPVELYIDNDLIAAVGGDAFPPSIRFSIPPGPNGRHRIAKFRFPIGNGGDPAGGLASVDTEVMGRHGNAMLEAAFGEDCEIMETNPILLPSQLFSLKVVSAAPANFPRPHGAWHVNGLPASSWHFNGRLPKEWWVNSLSVSTEETFGPFQNGPAPSDSWPYECFIQKQNVPTGDQHRLLWAANDASGVCFSKHFGAPGIKLPMYSIFSPWTAETPNMEIGLYGTHSSGTGDADAVQIFEGEVYVRLGGPVLF